jgi:parallel beta-helix repeat protein
MALTKANNRMIDGAPVNVKDFGAVGDGVADDTAAIQAAIDSGAHKVYIPSGAYLVDSLSTVNNMELYGSGQSILKLFGSATVALRSVGDNVSIHRLSFDLDDVTDSVAINDAGGENVSITNCKFYDHTIALNLNSSGNWIRFINNEVYRGGYGVLVNSSASGSDLLVSNNVFNGGNLAVNRDAIEINLPTGTFPHINISDNLIKNYDAGSASSGFGVGMAGAKYVTVANNVIENCGYQGIHLEDECEHCNVIGNVVSNTGGGTNAPADTTQHSGIWVAETYFSNISNNIVYNSVGSGIKLTGATVSRHCKIDGNQCYDNGDNGIEVSTGRFIDVRNNHCKSNQNSGIEVSGPARVIVDSNFCYNEATPSGAYTQSTGINITGTPTNSVFTNNTCYDNVTDFSGVASSSTIFAAFNGIMDNAAQSATRTYTPTNVTTDRSYDANTVVVAELADVVGTLIKDLQEKGIIS